MNGAVGSPEAKVSITLDGMPGATPEEQFQNAYVRGIKVGQKNAHMDGNGTAWEMSRVGSSAYASTFSPELATGRSWNTFDFYTEGDGGTFNTVNVNQPNWAKLRQLANQS